jgi:hypothetical protein
MNDLAAAALLAGLFSVLIGLVEIPSRSKAKFVNCFNASFLLYLVILIIGNTATTLLVGATTATALPAGPDPAARARDASPSGPRPGEATPADDPAPAARDAAPTASRLPYPWFFFAFLGVFGFEAVLQNMNITFFNKGVLSINDWISKARDNAVAAAIESQTRGGFDAAQRAAGRLKDLPPKELKAHAINIIDVAMLAEITEKATQASADEALLIALALAFAAPDKVAAILKNHPS